MPFGTADLDEVAVAGLILGGVVVALTVDAEVELAGVAELAVDGHDVLDEADGGLLRTFVNVQVQSSPAATGRSLIDVPLPSIGVVALGGAAVAADVVAQAGLAIGALGEVDRAVGHGQR